MRLDDLLKQPGAWMVPMQETGIVVSSRVRLARNLRGMPFPGWAGEEKCWDIWNEVRPQLEQLKSMDQPLSANMADLKKLDKQILFERHLISREQSERGAGGGLVVRRDESVAIMVNEEDHLRLQSIGPGLELEETWKRINEVDTELEGKLSYSFSVRLGYLTACPSNVGTGMRASVMLHMPGLVLMDEMSPIVKGMGRIGLAVRGLWGEGTEATGNMFQVSNQITLGEKEADIIANLQQIVLELVEHEENARKRLLDEKEVVVRDHVGRAYGVLTHAHVLTSKESLDLLSGLRLGIDLGIVDGIDKKVVNELLILTQPGHLQKIEGRKLRAQERDEARARLVREKLTKPGRKTTRKRNRST